MFCALARASAARASACCFCDGSPVNSAFTAATAASLAACGSCPAVCCRTLSSMPSSGLAIFDSDGAAAWAAVCTVPPTRLPAPPSAPDTVLSVPPTRPLAAEVSR